MGVLFIIRVRDRTNCRLTTHHCSAIIQIVCMRSNSPELIKVGASSVLNSKYRIGMQKIGR